MSKAKRASPGDAAIRSELVRARGAAQKSFKSVQLRSAMTGASQARFGAKCVRSLMSLSELWSSA